MSVNRQSGYAGVDTVGEVNEIAEAGSGSSAVTPAQALLLCAFADTLDVDVDADPPEALSDPAALTTWLRRHNLVGADHRADSEDLELALTLRSGLRDAMMRHHDRDQTAPVPDLDTAASALPLRIVFDGTRPHLAPAIGGVRGGLARLLVAIAETQADDTWTRLKLCAADECQLAFYDTSKNRSRHWCSMGVCGNRQKTRTYRARQRARR
ncbi:CGNR zinc finger domain-containing protein [Kribbella sp. CA-247076]|uniref:CGNR zinc finger domain-containing protein n=1 Tax=Kribbella sp. CA-247076 TaxID=3239941 RepID=UPI003D89CFF1